MINKRLNIQRDDNRRVELASFLAFEFIASMATLGKGMANLNTVFYIHNNFELYFKSKTTSGHSNNLKNTQKVSFAIHANDSSYKAKYGVQLIGLVSRITNEPTMTKVVDIYSKKFEGAGAKLPSIKELCSDEIKSTFYKFVIEEFKIVDEDSIENRTMLEYEKI